ncbi:hypothetical protein [Thauera aromatica]|uniref:hypothetical protein n=1 Tax=Thauera aromatica TaxID=59405 RepID=UPI001FFC6CC3|nr:hypothetical protein [Thauera aromatica]MCK2097566.1 hypothetical protein [Thauera aromatica]
MIDPEKEREEFITIRQLVALIAQATGRTEQQGAALVSANLARNPAWSGLAFLEWSPAYGCTHSGSEECIAAQRRLVRWGNTGSSAPSFEDFDNDLPF